MREPKLIYYGLSQNEVENMKLEYSDFCHSIKNKKILKIIGKIVYYIDGSLILFPSFFSLVGLAICFIGSLIKKENFELTNELIIVIVAFFSSLLCLPLFEKIAFMNENKDDKGYYIDFPKYNKLKQYNKYLDDVKKYKDWIYLQDVNNWKKMDGRTFEIEVEKIFKKLGYSTFLSRKGADGGVDIVIKKDSKTIAVQCKAHKNKISESVARDLYGVLHSYNYDEGIIVSLSGASRKTYEFCNSKKDKPMSIMDVDDLIKMHNK